MSLIRKTELGEIEIHEITFSKLLIDVSSSLGGKAILSSKDGRVLGGLDRKITAGEVARNMYFQYDEKTNTVLWTFNVITLFGVSIKEISNTYFEYLIPCIMPMFPEVKGKITMNVTGIKSKNIAPRNLQITREF